jgi:DNA polymerase-3 subunit epsilon
VSASEDYYYLLEQIHASLSLYQYERALRLAYESLPLVPGLISEWSREYGGFDITSIPCIELAARFSSAQGDVTRLEQLRSWAACVPDLAPWLALIDQRIEAARAQPRILALVAELPGQLQSSLPKALGVSGRLTGRLVVDMEHLGLVERVPSGKSYALFMPGSAPAAASLMPAPTQERVDPHDVADSSDTWIALDFETATDDRNSACCLGIAVIQGGAIVDRGAWLIQPPGNRYERRNIAIHGIKPKMTRRSPTYAELYYAILPFLDQRHVIAHWADFDISVLRAVHAYYGIPLPATRYACSCRMAQRAFPGLPNHRLPTVCGRCGIPLNHHDATSDAAACAQIALSCRDVAGATTIHEAIAVLGVQLGSV